MKYMMLIAGDEANWNGHSEDDARAMYERVAAWWSEQASAGRIVGGHELEDSATATTVRIGADGGATVTDGPFIEGKEMVGGYAILETADLDEALRVASGWPIPGDALEVRPIRQRG